MKFDDSGREYVYSKFNVEVKRMAPKKQKPIRRYLFDAKPGDVLYDYLRKKTIKVEGYAQNDKLKLEDGRCVSLDGTFCKEEKIPSILWGEVNILDPENLPVKKIKWKIGDLVIVHLNDNDVVRVVGQVEEDGSKPLAFINNARLKGPHYTTIDNREYKPYPNYNYDYFII